MLLNRIRLKYIRIRMSPVDRQINFAPSNNILNIDSPHLLRHQPSTEEFIAKESLQCHKVSRNVHCKST